jgi:hypothetical protein
MQVKMEFKGFEGHVMVRTATNIEQYEVFDQLGISIMDLAGLDDGDASKNSLQGIIKDSKKLVTLLKLSEANYEEVSLKHIKTGAEYKSFDDINNDALCSGVMLMIASTALIGIQVNKEKK